MTHKHHILPRHLGGTDDPSNLIEVTVEEHAEIHRIAYEQLGHWQDELAWKGLEGRIGKEEIIQFKNKMINLGRKHTNEAKMRMSIAGKGKKKSTKTKERMSLAQIGNTKNLGKKRSDETKKKQSLALKGRIFTEEHKANLRKPKSVARKQDQNIQHSNYLKQNFWTDERKQQHSLVMRQKWIERKLNNAQ